ncbi:SNF2-related protein [Arthrobacter sp. zg-Y820]|uniref:DEAD/DEAH box helicase n=1 Tax=unclassified Arthrobacter TaxID=235627 RepID=UPI001E51CB00|nr:MULTISPECIES: SNF2-related protein [unclassified Arthrobacter]MCC9198476.1 DEAD/DEAH box helicase [Arthrobacter sp. zg-Y820]MDK1281346.1 SNF2-related protein [Arthrobacter sp. zg.Y820]WIB09976.1 SNF2-related protein [Arthrobacter sp. zg-Y820]
MPSSPPLIDVTDIIRVVGGAAFQRGQTYAKGGAVDTLEWDPQAEVLRAKVRGHSSVPYRIMLQLGEKRQGDYRLLDNHCSCPVGFDCKHVAAVALQSNTDHLLARQEFIRPGTPGSGGTPGKPTVPAWQESLQTLIDADLEALTGSTPAAATPLALQFEVRTSDAGMSARWGAPAPRSAHRATSFRLGVRPVVRNTKGNWVKNNLAWSNISYQTYGLKLNPEQHRWFSQFPALHRSNGVSYFGQNDSWLYLDDFSNPLLWQLLEEARRIGVEFVGTKKDTTVQLGQRAALSLDVRATEPGTSAPLQLLPVLKIDGQPFPTDAAGLIAGHGIYVRSPENVITLAPTARPLTDQDKGLLLKGAPVLIPEDDAPVFLEKFYPKLRQVLPVTSSDNSVEFPEISPPLLVLTASFQPDDSLFLDWEWEYRQGDDITRIPLGTRADPAAGYRDMVSEADLLTAVGKVLGSVPRSRSYSGIDTAEFTEYLLPKIEKVDGVRVDVIGERPDYRELTSVPELRITTVETERRDWFDLGIMITVDGRLVPFAEVFKALSQGKTKLLLPDRTYLSLDRPEFAQLHALLEETEGLQEWETGELSISRYQAGLWSELEELAEETEQAAAWRASVTGLLELDSVAQVTLPAGLHAELRPYQTEGYNWLAFLWKHGLGGILADDMGLGKTLQTLALLAHAREQTAKHDDGVPASGADASPSATSATGATTSTGATATATPAPRRPFLVVAPTSVVPNWLSEAARFTPGLRTVAIPDTTAKSKVPLAELTADVDLVITSYAVFRLDFASYRDLEWDGLILDEAQFVKNRTTRAHQCARDLKAPFKLAITGTPMENNLLELWSLFAIVAPGLFPSARKFIEEYQRPIERGEDSKLLARMRRRIRPLLMRRTKEAVAKDLPEKQEQVLEVELSPKHRKIYEMHLQRERQKLLGLIKDLDRNRMIVFRSLTLLRMLSLDASLVDDDYAGVPSAKLDALFEQLEDVTAEGHRALIFSQFTSFLKKAAERLDAAGIPYAYLDGSTRDRGAVINSFKDGEAPVFLISLKAGGFGLNLTEADYVFLLDPWWNPAAESQAVDRTHRIGQTRNVMVYRMVARGTIEEKVMALKEQKAKLFSSVMDDDAVFSSALTAEDIRSLLD